MTDLVGFAREQSIGGRGNVGRVARHWGKRYSAQTVSPGQVYAPVLNRKPEGSLQVSLPGALIVSSATACTDLISFVDNPHKEQQSPQSYSFYQILCSMS